MCLCHHNLDALDVLDKAVVMRMFVYDIIHLVERILPFQLYNRNQ